MIAKHFILDQTEFNNFLNQANPESIEVCGIPIKIDQASLLKKLAPREYALLHQAYVEMQAENRPMLRLVKGEPQLSML